MPWRCTASAGSASESGNTAEHQRVINAIEVVQTRELSAAGVVIATCGADKIVE